MNTINNSNTKHFCKDCNKTSLNACKMGNGDNILPCYILRKIAKKCNSIYDECYRNEDNLINNYYDKIRNWCGYSHGVKYLDKLRIKKELIMLSMSYVINSHTGNDLDFINEFSDDIKLGDYERNKVEQLTRAIFDFQTKIRNEWFATPANKNAYLAFCKAAVKNHY